MQLKILAILIVDQGYALMQNSKEVKDQNLV